MTDGAGKEPMIGSDEASDILGVHRATVLRWAADGKISVIHRGRGVNGVVLFSRAQIERLASQRIADRASA